jgi:rhodanese-related sulfurtransferase
MQIDTRKEILLIIIATIGISLIYNAISDNGLPLIRKGKVIELYWENDDIIDNLINTEAVIQNTFVNESSEKIISVNNGRTANETTQTIVKAKENNTIQNQNTLTSKDITDPLQMDTLQNSETADKNITPTAITIEQAYRLYNAGVVFLDARMEAEYNFGHIKGAINLPYKKVDEHISKISNLSKNSTLVTYCDGVGCDASIDLANKLAELGYINVRIFYSGWNDWKDKDYPVE